MADETTRSGMRWLWWVLGIVAIVLIGAWLFNAFSSGTQNTAVTPTTPNTGESGGAAGTTTVGAITANPESFTNKTVSVQGAVDRVHGQRVLLITEEGATGGGGLVVVSPGQTSAMTGDTVTVSGTVRVGAVREVLNQLGIEMPSGAENLTGERAILIANVIRETGGGSSSTSTQQ
jgi:hypothetical protein